MPEPVAVELEDGKQPEVTPASKPAAEVKKEEPQYVKIDELRKLTKQLDGISSALRTSEKEKKDLSKKLEDLESRLSGKAVKPAEAQDELDKLLEQGEWRTPVKKVAETAIEEALAKREAQANFQRQNELRTATLEESKKKVLERYPDINDPNSDNAKAYLKVLNANPRYLQSEFGPLLAMRDMEDEMDSKNVEQTDKESTRRARVNATTLRPGSPAKSSTVVLTREQKEFCKNSGLSEEAYLKTLKSINNRSSEMENS